MNKCPDDLLRLYRQARVIPFLGAGGSMSVSWSTNDKVRRAPSWKELVAQAAYLLEAEPELLRARGNDLQILEYFSILNDGTSKLMNWMSGQLSAATDSDILKSPIMVAMTRLDKCRLFYTTNYDDFLERALRAEGRNNQVVTGEFNINHDPKLVEVIKFHGFRQKIIPGRKTIPVNQFYFLNSIFTGVFFRPPFHFKIIIQ